MPTSVAAVQYSELPVQARGVQRHAQWRPYHQQGAGAPDGLVEETMRMRELDLAGASIAFLNCRDEIPFSIAKAVCALPRQASRERAHS